MGRDKKPIKKPGMVFNLLLKCTLGISLRHRFNVVSHDDGKALSIKPPFILIANHTNYWDPFIASLRVKQPVGFVTSDEYFRNPLVSFLLKLTGAIPKTKFMSDSATVGTIIKIIKAGGVIGIYPEGKRNWDGRTSRLLYPTAKLIKGLKVPVIAAVSRGAYLSYPRWAAKPRKGVIDITYTLVLDAEQIKTYDAEQVFTAIGKALEYDEYEWQRGQMIAFENKKTGLAEYIERFLFACPSCGATGSLKSGGSLLTCTQCSYSVGLDKFGFFSLVMSDSAEKSGDSAKRSLYFDNPHDWDEWQKGHLRAIIEERLAGGAAALVFSDSGAILREGLKMSKFKTARTGNLLLTTDAIVIKFDAPAAAALEFRIGPLMTGLNVQYNNQFEFYYNKTLYRFSFADKTTSAYKWVLAVKILEKATLNLEADTDDSPG